MNHILVHSPSKRLALDVGFELANQLEKKHGSVQVVMGSVEPKEQIEKKLNTFANARAGIP